MASTNSLSLQPVRVDDGCLGVVPFFFVSFVSFVSFVFFVVNLLARSFI